MRGTAPYVATKASASPIIKTTSQNVTAAMDIQENLAVSIREWVRLVVSFVYYCISVTA